MPLSSRLTIFLLLLILLLGAGLRVYHLGAEDLWLDEILTIQFASIPWSGLSLGQLDSDAITHFLADYVIMHLWLKLGSSAEIIRLFSVLVGIATIAVMFAVGRRLFNSQIGLFSALLLAISSYHIYYSQEARAYAFQVLLILSMVYFFYRGLEENKPRFWVLFSLISIFVIYLQAFSIFSLIAIDLYFIFRLCFKRRTVRIVPWLISQGTIFLGCLPYLWYLIRPSVHAERLSWIPKPKILDILNTFSLFSSGRTFWVLPEYLREISVCLFLFSVILSLISFTNARRKAMISFDRNSGTILTWCLFIIPIMLFYAISLKRPIYVADRYLIITLPFFYLLAAYGISKLEYRAMKGIIATILVCGMFIGLYTHYHEPTKIRWSQVARYLERNGQSHDLILIYPNFEATSLTYYLKVPIPLESIEDINKIQTMIAGYPRVWLVTVYYGGKQTPPEIYGNLNAIYHQQQILFTISRPSQVEVTLFSDSVNSTVTAKGRN